MDTLFSLSSLFRCLVAVATLTTAAMCSAAPSASSPEFNGCRMNSQCTVPELEAGLERACFVGTCQKPLSKCVFTVSVGAQVGLDGVTNPCAFIALRCTNDGHVALDFSSVTLKATSQCDSSGRLQDSAMLPSSFTSRYTNGVPPSFTCDACQLRYCGDGIVYGAEELCDGSSFASSVGAGARCNQRTCQVTYPITLTFQPAPMTYGELLGDAQLNAVSSVSGGEITYQSPNISPYQRGVRPVAGVHPVTAVWSPVSAEEIARYHESSVTPDLVVRPKSITCKAGTYTKDEEEPLPALGFTCEGLVEGDTIASLGGRVALAEGATPDKAGTYDVVFVVAPSSPNYHVTTEKGSLMVNVSNRRECNSRDCRVTRRYLAYQSGHFTVTGPAQICTQGAAGASRGMGEVVVFDQEEVYCPFGIKEFRAEGSGCSGQTRRTGNDRITWWSTTTDLSNSMLGYQCQGRVLYDPGKAPAGDLCAAKREVVCNEPANQSASGSSGVLICAPPAIPSAPSAPNCEACRVWHIPARQTLSSSYQNAAHYWVQVDGNWRKLTTTAEMLRGCYVQGDLSARNINSGVCLPSKVEGVVQMKQSEEPAKESIFGAGQLRRWQQGPACDCQASCERLLPFVSE